MHIKFVETFIVPVVPVDRVSHACYYDCGGKLLMMLVNFSGPLCAVMLALPVPGADTTTPSSNHDSVPRELLGTAFVRALQMLWCLRL